MANWRISKDTHLACTFQKCQKLIESLNLDIGKVFLTIEDSSLSDLAQIRGLTTLPDFSLRGSVNNFTALRKALDWPEEAPIDFFLVSTDPEIRRIIGFAQPWMNRDNGHLSVQGSAAAFELAKGDPKVQAGQAEWEFEVSFDSREDIYLYLDAALKDFQNEFDQGRIFESAVYGNLDKISALYLAGSIRASSELKGFLGFRPPGVPRTNVCLNRLSDLVLALDRMTTGRIELAQQIVGLGSKKYESWNLLNLSKDHRKGDEAILDLYSLTSIPAALRKALEQELGGRRLSVSRHLPLKPRP